jgi:hypothetical protein
MAADYAVTSTFNARGFVCYSESKYAMVCGYLGAFKFNSGVEIISYISDFVVSL